MGFPLPQKSEEMCVGRQIQVLASDPTGQGVCQMKKRIHCTSAPCASIIRCTSGMEVAHPLKQWSCRRWVWMDRTPRNRRIRSSVGGDTDMTGESTSGVTDSNFPHMTPRKTVVLNYYTLVSDDLISSDPNSGQYTTTFKCNIKDESYKQNRLFQPYRGLGRRCVN